MFSLLFYETVLWATGLGDQSPPLRWFVGCGISVPPGHVTEWTRTKPHTPDIDVETRAGSGHPSPRPVSVREEVLECTAAVRSPEPVPPCLSYLFICRPLGPGPHLIRHVAHTRNLSLGLTAALFRKSRPPNDGRGWVCGMVTGVRTVEVQLVSAVGVWFMR